LCILFQPVSAEVKLHMLWQCPVVAQGANQSLNIKLLIRSCNFIYGKSLSMPSFQPSAAVELSPGRFRVRISIAKPTIPTEIDRDFSQTPCTNPRIVIPNLKSTKTTSTSFPIHISQSSHHSTPAETASFNKLKISLSCS
jgi:hypothetical protein